MALRLRALTIHRLAGVVPATLRPAERTLVVGPNATGKSRLLALVATLLRGSLGDLYGTAFALDWTLSDSHDPTWQLRLHAEATTPADLVCRVEERRDDTLHRTVIFRTGAPAEVDGHTALVPFGAPRTFVEDWWRLQLIPWLVAQGHLTLPDGARSPGAVRRWSAWYFDEITHRGSTAPRFELSPHKVYWRAAPDAVSGLLMAMRTKKAAGVLRLDGALGESEATLRALLAVDAIRIDTLRTDMHEPDVKRAHEAIRWWYLRGAREIPAVHWSDSERHLAGLWWYLGCSPDVVLVDGLDGVFAGPWREAARAAMAGRQVWETAYDAHDGADDDAVVRCEAARGDDGQRWMRWAMAGD